MLQLSQGNVTHPAIQADLVIDEHHGSVFTRETLGKFVCGHGPLKNQPYSERLVIGLFFAVAKR